MNGLEIILVKTLFITLIVCASLAGGVWLWFRGRQLFRDSRDVCFELCAPASHVMAEMPHSAKNTITVDFSLLCQNLGLDVHEDSKGISYSTLPRPMGNRHGAPQRVFIFLSRSIAPKMRYAATACGVLAYRAAAHDTAKAKMSAVKYSGADHIINVPSPAPWRIGIDAAGHAVDFYPSPGSTILLCLDAPKHPAHNIVKGIPWSSAIVQLIDASEFSSTGTDYRDLEQQWMEAWSPHHVRVVVLPLSESSARTQCPILLSCATVVVSINADDPGAAKVHSAGYVREVTLSLMRSTEHQSARQVSPPSSGPREGRHRRSRSSVPLKARVASALAARSASLG